MGLQFGAAAFTVIALTTVLHVEEAGSIDIVGAMDAVAAKADVTTPRTAAQIPSIRQICEFASS